MTKAEQRRVARALRRALTSAERDANSAAVCQRLLTLPEVRAARCILSYRALPDEVDLSALERDLDAVIAYPRCLGGGVMEAYVPGGAFLTGSFGIEEPDPAVSRLIEPEAIDLVLAPCLGFDAARNRLGHGAGYYDRFLPRCKSAAVLAVAFEAQRLDSLVTEAHDRKMDAIVTEKTVYI